MKTIPEIKEDLKELIAEGALQEFFVEFKKVLNQKSTLYNDFVQLRSRYSRAVRDSGLGMIGTKEVDVFLNQINANFIKLIDGLKEKNLSDQYQKVEVLEENIATNSDFIKLKKGDLKFILDYNQELEEILDHDFELFALLDVHHGYSNFMALIEIRKILMENPIEEQILHTINLMNFEITRKKFELDMPGLANLELPRRLPIVKILDQESAKIFKEGISIEEHASLPIKYLSLIKMTNQLIKQSLIEQEEKDEDSESNNN